MIQKTSVAIDLKRIELTLLVTLYAVEMKKGVFAIMYYLMPLKKQLSMHAIANEEKIMIYHYFLVYLEQARLLCVKISREH